MKRFSFTGNSFPSIRMPTSRNVCGRKPGTYGTFFSLIYPDTTSVSFAYDTRGRRTSATDQNGKVTSYAYDDADRLTSITDAAQHVTTYAYDLENNLTSITDAAQHTTSFVYDAFGRVTQTAFPSSLTEKTLFTRRWAVLSLFIYRKNKNSLSKSRCIRTNVVGEEIGRAIPNRTQNGLLTGRGGKKRRKSGLTCLNQEEADS